MAAHHQRIPLRTTYAVGTALPQVRVVHPGQTIEQDAHLGGRQRVADGHDVLQACVKKGQRLERIRHHRGTSHDSVQNTARNQSAQDLLVQPLLHHCFIHVAQHNLGVHARQQLVLLHRLRLIVCAKHVEPSNLVLNRNFRGNHDDRKVRRVVTAQNLQNLVTTHAWHHDVQQHNVWAWIIGHETERLEAIQSLVNCPTFSLKQRSDNHLIHWIIVNTERHTAPGIQRLDDFLHQVSATRPVAHSLLYTSCSSLFRFMPWVGDRCVVHGLFRRTLKRSFNVLARQQNVELRPFPNL
mmetsp:Transcript_81859/g.187318  ORF Transcript_81859/g.187318 Transcript_81859/m.187318 type:complete len:296 (+) Transcript_81859:1908-2795(+)